MSDADYDAREGTLRAYKKKMLAENPNFRFVPAAPAAAAAGVPEDYLEPDCVAGAAAGQRCEVAPRARRGTIRWVGDNVASLAPGYWVGVELDEPQGLGDGSRGGVTYFAAADKHGAFVRPDRVSIGNFPSADDEVADGAAAEAQPAGASANADAGAGAGAPVDAAAAAAARVVVQLRPAAPRRRGQADDDDNDDEL
jgi:hypothetical protein